MRVKKLYIAIFVITTIATTAFMIPSTQKKKINGVNFVSTRSKVSDINLKPVSDVGANYLAVIPYAFTRGHRPDVSFNTMGQWYGETVEGTINIITEAKKQGLQVMLKPHIWVMGDGWAGEFELTTEEDWQAWEASFNRYILTYARLADSLNVEVFCMATEFRMVVRKRPEYWPRLISKIREVYNGKLTYAANWDNFKMVKFWDEMDYIGIDAYFPLVHEPNPDIKALRANWQPVKKEIAQLSAKYGKPILFTEYGYQSVDYGAGRHWEINRSTEPYNGNLQKNAYTALYEEFWKEDWFAGGFLWKWYPNHSGSGGEGNKRFTPQNKPAQQVVKQFYQQ